MSILMFPRRSLTQAFSWVISNLTHPDFGWHLPSALSFFCDQHALSHEHFGLFGCKQLTIEIFESFAISEVRSLVLGAEELIEAPVDRCGSGSR